MLFSLVLLSLLWSLVEVHSQTEYPYVSFMGETLPNHGYVALSLVGEDTSNSGNTVRCHTDLQMCCSSLQSPNIRGDWYFPDESRMGFATWDGDLYQLRDAQKTDLHRRNSALSPSGIYRCDIATNAVHDDDDRSVRESVYVGLYGSGGDIAIHDGITLTVDSDLTGASPQFTLTCISTGGPATTATWTRDSVPVTEGSETVLDDPVTAQYTHTLTVAGRLGGHYTCSLTNNKPSSVTANFIVEEAGSPTNLMTEFISSTTLKLSWEAPSDGDTVIGYIVWYSQESGEMAHTRLSASTLSTHIDHNSENIRVQALSQHLPSTPAAVDVLYPQPESVTIHPVNATAVRVSWTGSPHFSTSLQYTSYFTATASVMTQYGTVLVPNVTSTGVTLDDPVDGYGHNFTLHYIISSGLKIAPVTRALFVFDKKHFQIQFGPIDYCLNWGIYKNGRIMCIKDQLHGHLVRIIREHCTDCYNYTTAYLRRGLFLCHGNPTTVTYRSTLISPFPTISATHLVGIIQTWVSTGPFLVIDCLLVRVTANCPTCIVSLDDDECVGAVEPDSAVSRRISQVLSVCAVREIGQEICTI